MTTPAARPLGRRVNHDPQSRQFSFARRAEATAAVKDVWWMRRAPILDQLDLGSCVGNAAAGWLGTDDAVLSGREDITEALAVDLYSAATQIDPWPGSWPPEDTGTDGLSVCKVMKARGYISEYSHCFSLADVLSALQSGPLLTGTNWYSGMFTPGDNGIVTVSGDVVGGHEYLVVGVDTLRLQLIFANSWGTGWGNAGYFRMSYGTYERLLHEDGDATVPHAVIPAVPDDPDPHSAPWWQHWFGWLFQWLRNHKEVGHA